MLTVTRYHRAKNTFKKIFNHRWGFLFGKICETLQNHISKISCRKLRGVALPESIAVETCTQCNNNCSFCPQSSNPRPIEYLSEIHYQQLVDKIVDARFGGALLMSINNEPLLDSRLERFVSYARVRGFTGRIGMFTNGLLLSEERAISLLKAGVQYIIINSYSNSGDKIMGKVKEWIASSEKIKELNTQFPHVQIHLLYRCKDDVLDNRAGEAPNKKTVYCRRAACVFPFSMMNITTDGSLILCCYDFYCTTKFAHIGDGSLAELWRHHYLLRARNKLYEADRTELSLCAKCDFRGYTERPPGIFRFFPV